MIMSDTIAAIVVTYNRKELLIKCLEAIRKQTHKPDAIYIIDNLSTDGTPELLLEKQYIPKLPNKELKENQQIKHQVFSFTMSSCMSSSWFSGLSDGAAAGSTVMPSSLRLANSFLC